MKVSMNEFPYKREVVGEIESKENFSTFLNIFLYLATEMDLHKKITEFSMEELS